MSHFVDQRLAASRHPSQVARLDRHTNRSVANTHTQYLFFSLCVVSQLFYYYSWPVRPDRIICVLALATFVVAYFRGNTHKIKIQTVEYCMIAFTAFLSGSMIYGNVTDREWIEQSTVILQALNISLFPFLFYFVAKHLSYNREAVRNLSKCLVLVGLYLGLTAIFERYELSAFIWPSYIIDPTVGIHLGRSRGPFVNSVFLGMVLVFCIMNMLLLWSVAKVTLQRLLLGGSILVCMVGVYFTNTRGAFIGMGVALTTTMFFRVQSRRMVAIAFGIVIVGFVTVGANQLSLFGGKRQNTVVDREVNYLVALQMGMENPMFGIGWGRMGAEFDKYHKMIGSPKFGGWDGNHNEYLGIFAQVGIIALIIYVFILIRLIHMIVSAYRQLPSHLEFEKGLAVSALGCILCYMIMANFSGVSSHPLPSELVFLHVGIVASILRRSRSLSGI